MAAIALCFLASCLLWASIFQIFLPTGLCTDPKNNAPHSGPYVKLLTDADFPPFINSSSVGIVYFQRKDSRRIQAFFREYEKSAERLHAFGINLAKVNCNEHQVSKYCKDERSFHNAYGFRDGNEKIALPLDTLFDVDSIVSSALHLALIHNVPIIQSHKERKALENKCKGRFDIIFTYQRALGTYEHRVFMELAFTFLDKYVFAMTTYESAIQDLRRLHLEMDKVEDESGLPLSIEPVIWVLFCQELSSNQQDCSQNTYYGNIHLVDVVHFVQSLDYPLWVEFPGDPERSEIPYNALEIHLLYLISSNSSDSFNQLAANLGSAFRGSVGIVVITQENISRDKLLALLGLKSSDEIQSPGIVLKLKGQAALIWLKDDADVEQFVFDTLTDQHRGIVSNRDDDNWAMDELVELHQDDDVAEFVRLSKKNGSIYALSDATYATLEDEHDLSIVLFYVSWDPNSQVTLQILNNVQQMLEKSDSKELAEPFLAKVNCFDWPHICHSNNVSTYPTLKIFKVSSKRQDTYTGNLEENSILATIRLHQIESQIVIYNIEDGIHFCKGSYPPNIGPLLPYTILTGFENDQHKGLNSVMNVSKAFYGKILFGFSLGAIAQQIADRFQMEMPFLLICKPKDSLHPWLKFKSDTYDPDSITAFINDYALNTFGELTPHNFPLYRMQQHKDLLIYFEASGINRKTFEDFASCGYYPTILFSWIDAQSELVKPLADFYNLQLDVDNAVKIDFRKGAFHVIQGDALKDSDRVHNWLLGTSPGPQSGIGHTGYMSTDQFEPLHPGFDYLRLIDEDFDRDFENWMDREESGFLKDDSTSDTLNDYQRSHLLRIPWKRADQNKMSSIGTHSPEKHSHMEL